LFLVFFYTLPPLPAIARLASGAFYEAIALATSYEVIKGFLILGIFWVAAMPHL
jgi:hypothetical protein